ncbi:hypothetical protein [Halorubrum sp. Eb13]|uniref:hypothetical protein n=1 Tax=Halorubrum sp. Eb13 TaxID=1383843 RepID=UPI000B995DE3|nr:hypothetical protein [Halorubrum sp. Eb13]OYR47827.1 hypothetical protein DJ75_03900 [Halorubrum sp. Eb13]
MSEDADPFVTEMNNLEEEYGIEFPEELRVKMVEAGIQLLAEDRGEEVPESLQRLNTLSGLNRIYGNLRDKVKELNEMIEGSAIEDLEDERQDRAESLLARIYMHDDVLMFFILAQDLIEIYSIDTLNEELIEEDFRGTNETMKTLDRRMSQPVREQLLYRCGVIGHELYKNMRSFRDHRNDLVHKKDFRQAFDFQDGVMLEVDKGMYSINELHYMLEGERFWSEEGE